jgi:uncharacterized membrane protein
MRAHSAAPAIALRLRWRTLTPAARVTYAAVVVWLLFFWAAGIVQHYVFQSARFDLGNMTQALWNTAHGRFLEATTLSGDLAPRLAGHVDPLLAAFTPLWWAWPSPLLLVSVSAVALATGALPVFWLARKHLGSDRTARIFAFVYLVSPLTQWNAFWDFHPVSLAVPLILFAIWFLDQDRLVPFAVCAVLAASSKEEIPLAVGCLGVWYAFAHRRRLVGAAIFVLGAALTMVDFLVVIPHFAVSGQNPFESRYAAVGGSPGGILHTALTDPVHILDVAFAPHKLGYLLLLALPLCGLFLRVPLLALGAVPDLVINLLSSNPNGTSLKYQYTAGILPFLLAASILGAARLQGRLPRAPIIVLSLMIASSLGYGPWRYVVSDVRAAVSDSPLREARMQALALIPPTAKVTSSNHIGAHLAKRRYIYTFAQTRRADWAVIDMSDPGLLVRRGKDLADRIAQDPAAYRRAIARLRRDPAWKQIYNSHGVLVFRRVSPSANGSR